MRAGSEGDMAEAARRGHCGDAKTQINKGGRRLGIGAEGSGKKT